MPTNIISNQITRNLYTSIVGGRQLSTDSHTDRQTQRDHADDRIICSMLVRFFYLLTYCYWFHVSISF